MCIGMAGLGKTGAAMAARLHEMGVEVTGWNRSSEKAEASGLSIADTLHAFCERSDIIITSLFDDSAAVTVYGEGEGRLAAGRGLHRVPGRRQVRPSRTAWRGRLAIPASLGRTARTKASTANSGTNA